MILMCPGVMYLVLFKMMRNLSDLFVAFQYRFRKMGVKTHVLVTIDSTTKVR